MSKIGRNDPCPSGTGVKYKNCLRRHACLSPQSSAAAIWWVCDRWAGAEPDPGELIRALSQVGDPPSEKVERFVERVLAEPVKTAHWVNLLKECQVGGFPDLPGLYRRMNAALDGVAGMQPGWLQEVAADIFRDDQPEMYPEVLAATLALDPVNTPAHSLEPIVAWAVGRGSPEDCEKLSGRFPDFPHHLLDDEAEDDGGSAGLPDSDGIADATEPESRFPPEVEKELDLIWEEFRAEESPGGAEAEALVGC